MSIESAKLFIERVKSDEEFAKKIVECKVVEARMTFMRDAGFDFTAAELAEVMGELSDGELDKVAGGVGGIITEIDGCSVLLNGGISGGYILFGTGSCSVMGGSGR